MERIHKLLSNLGYGSRREIEEWIAEARVMVNNRPAVLGDRVAEGDSVQIDGQRVRLKPSSEPMRVLMYKKRTGEVVTRDDPEGRRTVFRKLPELDGGRWIAIGRLDVNTSGLLLLTNHGELARRLMHPSFEVPRTYAVRALGEVSEDSLRQLREGVMLDDGPAKFDRIDMGANEPDLVEADEDGEDEAPAGRANHWFTVSLREGRNREVRRMFEAVGLTVNRLIRTSYGPIPLGRGIKSGSFREVTPDELNRLITAVDLPTTEKLSPAQKAAQGISAPPPPASKGPVKREFEGEKWKRTSRSQREQSAPSRGRGDAGGDGWIDGNALPAGDDNGKPWGRKPRDGGDKPRFSRDGGDKPRFSRDGGDKPRFSRDGGDKPRFSRDGGDKPRFSRDGGDKPRFSRDGGDKPRFSRDGGDKPRFSRDGGDKPRFSRDGGDKPRFSRDGGDKPRFSRDGGDKPRFSREGGEYRPRFSAGADSPRPAREGGRFSAGADRPRPQRANAWAPREDGDRPRFNRDGGDKPRFNRDGGDKPRFSRDGGDKPRFSRDGGDKPRFSRDGGDKPRFSRDGGDKPRFSRDGGDKPRFSRDGGDKPRFSRDGGDKPRFSRDGGDKPRFSRDGGDKPRFSRDGGDKPRKPGLKGEAFNVKSGRIAPKLGLKKRKDDGEE